MKLTIFKPDGSIEVKPAPKIRHDYSPAEILNMAHIRFNPEITGLGKEPRPKNAAQLEADHQRRIAAQQKERQKTAAKRRKRTKQ